MELLKYEIVYSIWKQTSDLVIDFISPVIRGMVRVALEQLILIRDIVDTPDNSVKTT